MSNLMQLQLHVYTDRTVCAVPCYVRIVPVRACLRCCTFSRQYQYLTIESEVVTAEVYLSNDRKLLPALILFDAEAFWVVSETIY